jgi:hypothetical protein
MVSVRRRWVALRPVWAAAAAKVTGIQRRDALIPIFNLRGSCHSLAMEFVKKGSLSNQQTAKPSQGQGLALQIAQLAGGADQSSPIVERSQGVVPHER